MKSLLCDNCHRPRAAHCPRCGTCWPDNTCTVDCEATDVEIAEALQVDQLWFEMNRV